MYIGDYRQSKASKDEREILDCKMSEERRQRRLHIIRKPTTSPEQNHITLAKCAPANQDAGTRSKNNGIDKKAQQPPTIVYIIDYTPGTANSEWDISSAKIIPVPADGLCMYHCVHAAGDPDWMKNRHPSGTWHFKQ